MPLIEEGPRRPRQDEYESYFLGQRPLSSLPNPELSQTYEGGSAAPIGGQVTQTRPAQKQVSSGPGGGTLVTGPAAGGQPTTTPSPGPAVSEVGGRVRVPDWTPGFVSPDVNVEPFTPAEIYQGQYGNLFGPQLTTFGNIYTGAAALESGFEAAAGPSLSFEGLGGEEAIKTKIAGITEPGPETQAVIEDLSGQVGTQYTGPQNWFEVDPEALARLTADFQSLEGIDPLQGSGLMFLLRQTYPGATAAELEAEARKIIADPVYQAIAAQYGEDRAAAFAMFGREQEEAGTLAEVRGKEAADISARTRGALEGVSADIYEEIDVRAAEKAAVQQAIRDAWAKFEETGDFRVFEGLPEGTLLFDPNEILKNPQLQLGAEGWTALQGVMAQFPEIKDVPLLVLGISSHGRPEFYMDQEWLEAHKDMKPAEIEGIAEMALRRQVALIDAGFFPLDWGPGGGIPARVHIAGPQGNWYAGEGKGLGNAGPQRNIITSTGEAGQFAEYAPLFYGGGPEDYFIPEDWRSYVTPQGLQAEPTREGVATREEKVRLNAINEILDELERMDLDAEPFRTATIAMEVKKYLDNQIKALESLGTDITEFQSQYLADLRHARKRYKKLERKKEWAQVASIMGDVLTMGGTQIAPYVPVGGDINEAIVGGLGAGAYELFG